MKWTIPNILSTYRLLAVPALLIFAFTGKEDWFATGIVISLITDVLDGFIARRFNLQTAIGAKLDSIADVGTYICVFTGMLVFKWGELEPHSLAFFIFLGLYAGFNIFTLIKFGTSPSLHLYSFKVTGYIQGFFFLLLFTYGFITWYYYLAIGVGYIALLEEYIVIALLREPRSNVKSVFYLLKERSAS